MKHAIRFHVPLTFLLLVSATAEARPVDSLPHLEDFEDADGDTSEYADAVRLSNDADAVHLDGGGWDGGDAVRFDVATVADSYQGLMFTALSETRLCVRYLINNPATMLDHLSGVQEPKLMIWQRVAPNDDTAHRLIHWWSGCHDGNESYPLMISGRNNAQLEPPGCAALGAYNVSSHGPDWICSKQGNAPYPEFSWDQWLDQWVSVEICADIAAGSAADGSLVVYVSTRDGSYDDTVVLQPPCGVSNIGVGAWGTLDLIGMYGGGVPATSYAMDDVVINNAHIGPPPGFVGGGGGQVGGAGGVGGSTTHGGGGAGATSAGGAAAGGSTGGAQAGGASAQEDADGEEGCGCRQVAPAGGATAAWSVAMLLGGIGLLRRRRRRRAG